MSDSSTHICCAITSIVVESSGKPHISAMFWINIVYVFVDLTTLDDAVDAGVDDSTFGGVVDVVF
jgi:hypothetical protein